MTLLTYLRVFQRFVDPALVLAVRAVKIVLDAVVRTTWQLFGDVRPLVT